MKIQLMPHNDLNAYLPRPRKFTRACYKRKGLETIMIQRILRLVWLCFLSSTGTFLFAQSSDSMPVLVEVAMAMEKFVEDREVAGVVTLVADRHGIVHQHATGWSDLQVKKPMAHDSIFWIASMTKPITGVCVMMLVEEGKLSLDSPISEYLPEMSQLKLSDGTPARITLKHLLSHTSGIAELPGKDAYSAITLAEAADRYAHASVLFPPGTKWQYSQTSINTAARLVEVASGLTFDQYVEKRLCLPLGMTDTTFYLEAEQVERLAKSYQRTSEGELVEAPIWLLLDKSPTDRDRFPAANGGLFSTIADYGRFCRMLLNGGQLDGVRVLTEQSVSLFHSPAIDPSLVTGFTPGNTWGLGCCILRQPQGVTADLNPGTFGHGGAFGTQAWIDPQAGRCYLLMVQRANFPNADASEVRRVFQQLASRSLESSTQ